MLSFNFFKIFLFMNKYQLVMINKYGEYNFINNTLDNVGFHSNFNELSMRNLYNLRDLVVRYF